jgi:hypothetical protein
LKLVGADVWFDAWDIKPGESIVGKINEALELVDTLILLWSASARKAPWVRAEMASAISRALAEGSVRVIPVRLDETPLPPLLADIKRVDLFDGDVARAVDEIMGFASDADRLRAIQETLDTAGIEVGYFYGYGAIVCCPHCGAVVSRLEGWSDTDHANDRMYAGVRCTVCLWSDGGEV